MSAASQDPPPEEAVDRARRRLLRAGIYSAPAVIGWLLTSQAAAQPSPSCNPCNVINCQPDIDNCNPP